MEEFPQMRNLSLIVVDLVDEEVVNMAGLAVKKNWQKCKAKLPLKSFLWKQKVNQTTFQK